MSETNRITKETMLESSIVVHGGGEYVSQTFAVSVIEQQKEEIAALKSELLEVKARVLQVENFITPLTKSCNPLIKTAAQRVLDMRPKTSLAEHDAEVVEKFCDHAIHENLDLKYQGFPDVGIEYANQLRNQNKSEGE